MNVERIRCRITPVDPTRYHERMGALRSRVVTGRSTERIVEPPRAPDQLVRSALPLGSLLPRPGHVLVEPMDDWGCPTTWVQATNLSVLAFADDLRTELLVTDLATGVPRAGVEVAILGEGGYSRTNDVGRASLRLPQSYDRKVLLASDGPDRVLQPISRGTGLEWHGTGEPRRTTGLVGFVETDRGVYRPGETATVSGWIRLEDPPGGRFRASAVRQVRWQLVGSRSPFGTAAVDEEGFFAFESRVIDTGANPPGFRIETADVPGLYVATASFKLRPAPPVELHVEALQTSVTSGESATFVVRAMRAGRPLAGVPIQWGVVGSALGQPVEREGHDFSPPAGDAESGSNPWLSLGGETDQRGQHKIVVRATATGLPRVWRLTANASVKEDQPHPHPVLLSERNPFLEAHATIAVEGCPLHPGLRDLPAVVPVDRPLPVEALVVDGRSTPVSGVPISLQVLRTMVGAASKDARVVAATSVKSGTQDVDWPVRLPGPGLYRVIAEVSGPAGGPPERTERTVLAVDESSTEPVVALGTRVPSRVVVYPERTHYVAGETMRVLLLAPFAPAEGMLSIARNSILSTQRLSLDRPATWVEVPLPAKARLGVELSARLVGRGPGPHGAAPWGIGSALLDVVDPGYLDLDAQERDGGFLVSVRDVTGAPIAGAHLAVSASSPGLRDWKEFARPDAPTPENRSEPHPRTAGPKVWLEPRPESSLWEALFPEPLGELPLGPPRFFSGWNATDWPMPARIERSSFALRSLTTGPDGTAFLPFRRPPGDGLTLRLRAAAGEDKLGSASISFPGALDRNVGIGDRARRW